jgi:hypothetical protein
LHRAIAPTSGPTVEPGHERSRYARKQHFADVEFTEFAFKVSSIEGATPLLHKHDVAVVRSDFMHNFSGLCFELQNARTPCAT